MPKSKPGNTSQRSDAKSNRRSANSGRFEEVSKSSAQIVKDAAALLDEELAAGIQAAKQVQQRFRKEQRIDPADFSDALQRFQADAHEVIGLLNDRLNEMRSQENFQPVQKLLERSHDLVDLAVELVTGSAEIANQIANSPVAKEATGRRVGRKG
jgi:hypothetical protein